MRTLTSDAETFSRDSHVNHLLTHSGAEDERVDALNAIDAAARRDGSWGTKEHRSSREKTESKYDQARRSYEAMSDDQLKRAVNPQA